MTVADDIKGAIVEVGTAFTVRRESGSVSGEYLDFTPNAQATQPFTKEFFLEAEFPTDTAVSPGEVIQFDITGDNYMVMNKTPDILANEVIQFTGVLYKCNVSGEILRPSGEVRNTQTYLKEINFVSIKTEAYGLQTSPLFGNDLETNEELGAFLLQSNELYIPSSYGITVGDRYLTASGEYMMVNGIKTRRYPGVHVAILVEDTR